MMELWRRAVRACFGGKRRDVPASDAVEDDESLPDSDAPGIMGEIDRIAASVPDEVWEKAPRDMAEQHDHYIYGTKKK